MPIAKESGNFTPLPAGTHQARCYGVIDLGTQHSELYADAWKVMILWETPHERITMDKEERPMTISKEYTLSLSKKSNLRKHLETWRGRVFTKEELEGFDVANVIGAPCLLSVTHKESGSGNTYAAIEAVSAVPKGMDVPPLFHKTVKFDIADGESEIFKGLPEWIQKKVTASEEWGHPKPATTPPRPQAAPNSATPGESDEARKARFLNLFNLLGLYATPIFRKHGLVLDTESYRDISSSRVATMKKVNVDALLEEVRREAGAADEAGQRDPEANF